MEHVSSTGHDEREQGLAPRGDRVAVLTVDDQDYFRGVMREVVEATEGFKVIGEAASGEEALEAAELLSPDLIIIDKRMPGIGGVEACRLLRERNPDVVVLVVSVEDPDSGVMSSCQADGMLRKQDLTPGCLQALWRDLRRSAQASRRGVG